MKITEWKELIANHQFDSKFAELYGQNNVSHQIERYNRILANALSELGNQEAYIFSAPGRTEVGGNHTDHQLGRVLAASINLDVVAVVVKRDDHIVRYLSDGFTVKPVDVSDRSIHQDELNSTEALIRGIASKFYENGVEVSGFDCYAESDVLPGSGMSSSAAFEVLIGTIMNELDNEGKLSGVEIAKIGQYAENVYFGKPCGLLDQMACSVGGFVTIDFKDKENLLVEKVPFDFASSGYVLILTDCKQSHADLSDEYALVPGEMKHVAKVLGHEVLSQCEMEDLLTHAKEVRDVCGDRAFLRAFHFFHETNRVLDEVSALKNNDMELFLRTVIESGDSSYKYLQNVYPPFDSKHQSLAVGLALSEEMLKNKGAWRVHGGGFAGTIQAFVPQDMAEHYVSMMESVFGENCCYELMIRPFGGIQLKK